jgi:hypothetical protein
MASYSPTRRVQLNYQVATQWYSTVAAQRWTELQTVVTLTKSTSLHGVTGFPDITSARRFRFGLQQTLPRGFRLAVDYGALPAFQSSVQDRQEHARFLVMVRRTLAMPTPAAGAEVTGRVVDQEGEPVPGAAVTLGPYVTTVRSDGSYKFAHVPTGDYDLALDEEHLPARYASDGVTQHVHVSGGRVEADLHAIPLHAIHGHVFVDRNGNGEFDTGEGVPNVVMRLSARDVVTMTNDEGVYGFYNVLPGVFDVQLDTERLSKDFQVASAATIAVTLDAAGKARTGIDFRLAPREKPIVLQRTLSR